MNWECALRPKLGELGDKKFGECTKNRQNSAKILGELGECTKIGETLPKFLIF